MTLDELFDKLPGALNAQAAAGVDATVQFNNQVPRHVVIRDGVATVNDGQASPYTVGITMSDDDLVALLTGDLDGMTAFMTGRIKLDGDLMFAQRIGSLFDGSKLKA
ncbi:MAG: SCP2 sterol-binding domain-containing protein [Pseudomonadota bacterium]